MTSVEQPLSPGNSSNTRPKRRHDGSQFSKKKKLRADKSTRFEGSHDEILAFELGQFSLDEEQPLSSVQVPAQTEVEVHIKRQSSTGDGLGEYTYNGARSVAIVPFSLPGDVVLAKVVRHSRPPQAAHTYCDFIKVIEPSSDRDDSLIKCRYFAKCGGCHFQMVSYARQLRHKRDILMRAYQNFSGLPDSSIPKIRETMGSPFQYGYRTKLTPHFDGPPGGRRAARSGQTPKFTEVPPIGFMLKGTRRTLDIEECPIATDAVQEGLIRERARVSQNIDTFRKGATILLREDTKRVPDGSSFKEAKTCTSNNNGVSTEYVDDYIFENRANAFFQNNNSILSPFINYIRQNSSHAEAPFKSDGNSATRPRIKNLIDAYSGSGLFTITLHSMFEHSIGIDISAESIEFARRNARLNGVDASNSGFSSGSQSPSDLSKSSRSFNQNVRFLAGDANTLFASVPKFFKPDETLVILDPPRKGCDEGFLQQLVDFGPARIVYVSCNVHTQARDIGWIIKHAVNDEGSGVAGPKGNGSLYEIESLRGFDFFPQTSHVEGVAVLEKKSNA